MRPIHILHSGSRHCGSGVQRNRAPSLQADGENCLAPSRNSTRAGKRGPDRGQRRRSKWSRAVGALGGWGANHDNRTSHTADRISGTIALGSYCFGKSQPVRAGGQSGGRGNLLGGNHRHSSGGSRSDAFARSSKGIPSRSCFASASQHDRAGPCPHVRGPANPHGDSQYGRCPIPDSNLGPNRTTAAKLITHIRGCARSVCDGHPARSTRTQVHACPIRVPGHFP
jgi:hypothetical protein